MAEIGLFPLGVVLLPTEIVPLHIFEERYKELIDECLQEERDFGLVFAHADGMEPVGTRASVADVVARFDDGRLNIVVEGGARFRVVALTSGRTFITADVEPVEDDLDPADSEDASQVLALFGVLVELTGSDVQPPDLDDPQLSFAVASRVELEPELKQALLAETSERKRVKQVVELLENLVETLERQQEIAARAATNGRVSTSDPSSREG